MHSSRASPIFGIAPHMSFNSVTDEKYIAAASQSESDYNKQVKSEMLSYLSRVSDKNKPLFMFNHKLKTGKSQDIDLDDSSGTPRFNSLVSLLYI
jgi:hypothetical protein